MGEKWLILGEILVKNTRKFDDFGEIWRKISISGVNGGEINKMLLLRFWVVQGWDEYSASAFLR